MTRTPWRKPILVVVLLVTCMLILVLPSVGVASEPPIKEILTSHMGWEVDTVTKGPICTVVSGDACQAGVESSEPGGFQHAEGVGGGGAPAGHVYVADGGNHRVQELAADGEFIAMFGREVNANKTNVCLAGETCKAGVEGTAPGQFTFPQSIAVDPTNDDFYVAELHSLSERVQKFTAAGQFLWEIGKEVNTATKGNLCTLAEIANCKGPAESTSLELTVETSEPGAFAFGQFQGNILAVGGPENHLYVGDERIVQEFRPDGTWEGEPLTKSETIAKRLEEISSLPRSNVTRITVDKTGIVYVGYSTGLSPPTAIRQFDQTGKETNEFPTAASVVAMAVDGAGRLAVVENTAGTQHYYLFEITVTKLHLMTEFADAHADDISFNGNDELFGAGNNEREILAYHPVLVAELLLTPTTCKEGAVNGTSVTLDCTLNGTVNPEGVTETVAWFKWGRTPILDQETPKQTIPPGNTPIPLSAPIEGVRPNEPLYVQLAGEDQNVKAPEQLTSELERFQTNAVPPRIIGDPTVSFVRASTVLMSGNLNPENANTQYEYQYGPCPKEKECASSPYTAETPARQSEAYTKIKAILEATNLQPNTPYHYRLTAVNQAGTALNEKGEPELPEGEFTTAPTPIPHATTGQPEAVGTTSAILTGTVNPDGQPSTYSFEIQTGNTQPAKYSPVYTASAGTGTTDTRKTFVLTGLQPGTQYSYRITIKNGFGETASTPTSLTTQGLAEVLPAPIVPAQLPVPNIPFPKIPAETKGITRAEQLAHALKACEHKPKNKRATCKKNAHKKYATTKTKNKNK
jgi:hypothetical protein